MLTHMEITFNWRAPRLTAWRTLIPDRDPSDTRTEREQWHSKSKIVQTSLSLDYILHTFSRITAAHLLLHLLRKAVPLFTVETVKALTYICGEQTDRAAHVTPSLFTETGIQRACVCFSLVFQLPRATQVHVTAQAACYMLAAGDRTRYHFRQLAKRGAYQEKYINLYVWSSCVL